MSKKSKSDDQQDPKDDNLVDVQIHSARGAHVPTLSSYKKTYKESITDAASYWGRIARKLLYWDHDFICTHSGSLSRGDSIWFLGGKLNACVECLDRHVWNVDMADQIAIVWERDEPGEPIVFTFREALDRVCRISNCMKNAGVKKGDAITVYMPMMPEAVFVMLAAARLGAPHSVVFAGFSSDALRDRIVDVKSKFVFTSDEGLRGGKAIPLKYIVDEALKSNLCDFVERVFVFQRTGNPKVTMRPGRDEWLTDAELNKFPPYCPPESCDSEDILFFLYTSGSTGKPKGLAHTTAGYLVQVAHTHKLVFDIRPGDKYACVADVGWITGHSYIVYGPLTNGCCTFLFESTPMYPDAGRYWSLVEKHRLTHFYTAPTAIRALMKFGVEFVNKYDLSSLRVLGSVGEPLGPAPWKWYYEHVGKSRCAIVDTYWQTETGGHMLTTLPSMPMKPGCCGLPFFGIEPVLLDPTTGQEILPVPGETQSGVLCIKQPWPGMARTVRGDHERYMSTYLRTYQGYYFTGDGATRDKDGFFCITGRVDDVLNPSGHRIGSAEIEGAINSNPGVAESAAIGFPHDVKGEGIAVYVVLKDGFTETPEILAALKTACRQAVGAFATPDQIIVCGSGGVGAGLPKTRSGKIMRRILRKILANELDSLGDTSTLADPSVVDVLIAKVNLVFGRS